jgi:hypothetical protein
VEHKPLINQEREFDLFIGLYEDYDAFDGILNLVKKVV